ncbi:MAG: hypothetical protein ACLTS6_06940 [Anaerobutyricum sp.]
MPARNLDLYAQWEKRPVYHLQYDANNGSGKRRTDAETPCEKQEPRKSKLMENALSLRVGLQGLLVMFTQWNTKTGWKRGCL